MPDSPHAPPAPPSPSAQVARDAADYQPYVPPPSTVPMAIMVPLTLRDPLRWLGLGWRDFMAAPGIGVFYGLCFWAMAAVLTLVTGWDYLRVGLKHMTDEA